VSVPQADYYAHESVALVNEARTQAGLARLSENAILDRVAMAYSRRMADEGFYGHADPQGKLVNDRIAAASYLAERCAENIARGQRDPATVVDEWLHSPGHRANIMNSELREIGAGYAVTTTPPYFHYWTHVFATQDASMGRDRNNYPAHALAQINQFRQRAGAASPEEVVAQWTKRDSARRLQDKALRAAGVAYTFVAQDEFRHYWLLLLGG
jgi:uncharacterized protein YkwD